MSEPQFEPTPLDEIKKERGLLQNRGERSQSVGALPTSSSGDVKSDAPKLESIRAKLSAAASGPTQLWLFLLELLLLEPEQKCIKWTGRGWEFLMGKLKIVSVCPT